MASDVEALDGGASGVNRFRASLDEECHGCGKQKEEAEEIAPVTQGHWSFGPEWSCGDCLPGGEGV